MAEPGLDLLQFLLVGLCVLRLGKEVDIVFGAVHLALVPLLEELRGEVLAARVELLDHLQPRI